jgi:hypothetical protein
MTELTPDERAELEQLRREAAARQGRGWVRASRWVGAVVVLMLAAVLGSLAVVATYLRSEVLDTNTYVETVAPLGADPTVRTAVAARLADEIVARSDVESLANQLADRLVTEGAPARITDLVSPLVGGLRSFLNTKLSELMATPRFEQAWQNINRIGHQGLVTALTGGQGQVITSEGNTVSVDLGELLTLAKQQLVAEGFGVFGKIPDVSIPYTLVESSELPKIRTYTKLLNAVGTWLPWVALVVLIAGVLVAPNRRRGIVLGTLLLASTSALLLAVITAARTYYVDNLPPEVRSPEAAEAVITTVLRYLMASLQTLIVASLILAVAALLAGPSAVAVVFRRLVNRGLDGLASLLRRAGTWVARTGQVIAAAAQPLRIGIVLLAVVLLIAANRPGIPAVLWTTVAVLVVLVVLEVFVRAGPRRPGVGGTAPA